MTIPATPRQMAALRFVAGYIEANGVAPTMDEVARGIGARQRSCALRIFNCLAERGHIRRVPKTNRSVAIQSLPTIPRSPDGEPLYFVAVEGAA